MFPRVSRYKRKSDIREGDIVKVRMYCTIFVQVLLKSKKVVGSPLLIPKLLS